jgi:hypothetical protein
MYIPKPDTVDQIYLHANFRSENGESDEQSE